MRHKPTELPARNLRKDVLESGESLDRRRQDPAATHETYCSMDKSL